MKANRTFRNDRAEVGVGTLIVFIAMVLVAAVAAAVLINTTGTLQQRAQSTGKEATQEVSSNLKVLNVYGIRADGDGPPTDINEFKINVELAAGALPLDLSKLIVRWSNGTSSFTYSWAATQSNSTTPKVFEITCIRGSCSDSDPVMRSGDLVEIYFSMPASSYLATRTNVEVTLTPETGTPVQADFKTPSTYGSNTVITLR